jgi:hypothetical protein
VTVNVHRRALACLFVSATATAAALVLAGAGRAATPVPSLTPAATQRLWTRLVHDRAAHHALHHAERAAAADCRPTRVIVYAQTDWLRVATKLAASGSPCAQYYVSVPPLTSNKTLPRPGQAARIRALGPNFHALAEINWNGWSKWVSTTQSSWAQAGITARQNMAAAGYDVAAGDTWALNELTTAVRKNTGAARQNVRDLVRGLFTGDGTQPTAKGVVFAIGAAQPTNDVSQYKATLQSWFQDAGFWADMSAYVGDWGQEVYGDVRNYGVPNTTPQARRDQLEQYMGGPAILARSDPAQDPAAAAYLTASYVPLANAAWAWASSYGWTQLPFQQMQDYVSAQVYAARALSAGLATGTDRIGFAWAPNNTLSLAPNDFTSQSGQILDRLGQAIRDSADDTADPTDPGITACGPFGQPLWCSTVVDGATFATAWSSLATWTQSSVGFASPPFTLTAGSASGPITLQVQTGSVPTPALQPVVVALTSTSPQGAFALSPAGPWSPSLTITIPAGSSNALVYYEDAAAGTPTLTAAVPGQPAATQTETIVAGAPAAITLRARAGAVLEGGRVPLRVAAQDALRNPVTSQPTWTVAPASLGRVAIVGGVPTFVAGAKAGTATITAANGPVSAATQIVVKAPPPRIASTRTTFPMGHVVVAVRVVAGSKPARGVRVDLRVRKGSSVVGHVTGRTNAAGLLVWRSHGKLPRRHYTVKARIVKAPGVKAPTR